MLGTTETAMSREECTNSLRNVIDALYVLNGKWKLPVILSLVQSPRRFNEILNEIKGLSPKVLANELKDLEQNDLVKRQVFATTPVTIIYEATDYSHTLKEVLQSLNDWGFRHREKIRESMKEAHNA